MTATTETTTARTCPPSDVADMIVRWDEVREGDAVLWNGTLRLVESWMLGTNRPDLYVHVRLSGLGLPTQCLRDSYTAVRRYTEGPSEADELRAELELFKPQPMSQNCRDGKHNGSTGEPCCNCWCLCHRGDLSRERDTLVLAALDEAADDRNERAADARRHDRIEEQREHNERAREYRELRDRLEAGRG